MKQYFRRQLVLEICQECICKVSEALFQGNTSYWLAFTENSREIPGFGRYRHYWCLGEEEKKEEWDCYRRNYDLKCHIIVQSTELVKKALFRKQPFSPPRHLETVRLIKICHFKDHPKVEHFVSNDDFSVKRALFTSSEDHIFVTVLLFVPMVVGRMGLF